MPENKAEDIKNICKIYKEMTFDGHKPKEGLEKARCMLFAQKYYYEEIKKKVEKRQNKGKCFEVEDKRKMTMQ